MEWLLRADRGAPRQAGGARGPVAHGTRKLSRKVACWMPIREASRQPGGVTSNMYTLTGPATIYICSWCESRKLLRDCGSARVHTGASSKCVRPVEECAGWWFCLCCCWFCLCCCCFVWTVLLTFQGSHHLARFCFLASQSQSC